MNKFLIFSLLLFLISWMACLQKPVVSKSQQVKDYYLKQIVQTDTLVKQLQSEIIRDAPIGNLQKLFKSARLAYKKAEFLAEYYSPVTSKAINGAPIPSMDDNDQHKIDLPEGFQVIEPFLFPIYETSQKEELVKQVGMLLSSLGRLKLLAEGQELADQQIFDALRIEVFRVISLGISGFDAPIAQNSMAEGASALISLKEVLRLYESDFVGEEANTFKQAKNKLEQGIAYLSSSDSFNSFDRMAFITQFGNPISEALTLSSGVLGLPKFKELRALKADAKTLFDVNVFDPDYYTANYADHYTAEKAKLGKRLFYDVVLSGAGSRSCGTCHRPEKGFTDGLVRNSIINGTSQIRRNTLTVLNAGFQPSLFYDNRVNYLEDQASEVINNRDEMHGSLPQAVEKLKRDKRYLSLFRNAFSKSIEPITEGNIKNALGSYIRTLISLNSAFDKYVRGNKTQLTADEIKGFNLYMGKAKCGTCHFTPLFNGTVPPDFRIIETEVIGVPGAKDSKIIDSDLGKYDLRKLDLYKHAFRTPTLRNIALTAPYMHNGIYENLEDVIDFYNDGGGVGLGMNIPNQTLPFDKLNLTDKEKKQIVVFLMKLTDNTTHQNDDVN